jgi:5'-3' exonuclease
MTDLIIDSNGIAHAARIGVRELSYEKQATGVVFGFLSSALRLAATFNPCRLVFCWDSRKSRRKSLFPGYKEKRHEGLDPDEQVALDVALSQFDLLRKEILPGVGFRNVFMQTGHEADDVMAEIVITEKRREGRRVIVTRDKDMLQMLDYCDIYDPQKKKTITADTFESEWGIPPKKWRDVKSIAGCTTDTVPGVKGVAEKTAVKYLTGKLKSSYKVYQDIESESGQGIIKRNRKLVVLPLDSTATFTLMPDELSDEKWRLMAMTYGMKSLLKGAKRTAWDQITAQVPF